MGVGAYVKVLIIWLYFTKAAKAANSPSWRPWQPWRSWRPSVGGLRVGARGRGMRRCFDATRAGRQGSRRRHAGERGTTSA